MLLWRLWSRPDRRFLVAALGIAAAILLPVAGTLVIQGLDIQVDEDAWIMYRADGGPLPRDIPAHTALRFETENGAPVAAYVIGEPLVGLDESANDPSGTLRAATRTIDAPLLPPGTALVHPGTLIGTEPHVALLDKPVELTGIIVAPARGPDAFETAGLESLQSQTIILVLASVPAVALVAVAFGDHEARQRARSAATLAALGRPQLGRAILALRFLWLMTWAVAMATVLGFLLWRFGGPAFRPEDTQPLGLALAIAVPATLGGIVGLWWAMARIGNGEERLRTPPAENDAPGARIGWLPVLARPIALGTRLLPLLLVAGILFGINLGFPLAAASVPAAIAGGSGEWVIGSDGGISFGGTADARPADVMALDPDIDAIVAERLLPTLVNGQPTIIRGGDLAALAAYHGANGVGESGLWLGERLAERLGVGPGDAVRVQATQPYVATIVVAGIFTGGGVLADEALLDNEAAGELTGHAPGRATVLRMRPDTDEARSALSRGRPQIEVLDVRTQGAPTSGQDMTIHIDVVNLAGASGVRELPVRINGNVQTVAIASLGPYARATIEATVVTPVGPFQIEVNPTVGVDPEPSAVDLRAPRIVFLPDPIQVQATGEGTVALRNGTAQVNETTLRNGQAELQAPAPGRYQITYGEYTRNVIVSPDAYRDEAHFVIDALWTTPYRPAVGTTGTLHVAVTNIGASGEDFVNATTTGGRIVQAYGQLLAGQSGVLDISFTRLASMDELRADEHVLSFGTDPSSLAVVKIPAERSAAVQNKVADRVLGDAQTSLMGLATISLVSILSVVYLGTERTLQGRAHVPKVLHALGVPPDQIRYRAAWEAAILAAASFLIAAFVAKATFQVLGRVGWPLPFAHSLPDPIGLWFILQAGTAFAGAAALASYMATGRILGVRR